MNASEAYLDQIREGVTTLQYVPRKEKTHALCLAAVHKDGRDIVNVPLHLRSKAVCYSAVFQNAIAIKAVPIQVLEEEPGILELALGRQGTLLEWAATNQATAKLLTEQMCQKAVNSHGGSLKYVPALFRSREMVRQAIIRDGSLLVLLANQEMLVADLIDQIPLKHLPDQFKTREICLEQVSKQGRLLRYVPMRVMDEEIIQAALESNPWAIEYVPATFADFLPVRALMREEGLPRSLMRHLLQFS